MTVSIGTSPNKKPYQGVYRCKSPVRKNKHLSKMNKFAQTKSINNESLTWEWNFVSETIIQKNFNKSTITKGDGDPVAKTRAKPVASKSM